MARFISLVAAMLMLTQVADAALRKEVTRTIVKVAVDKVLTVKLAADQPTDVKLRAVEVTMAGTADGCADAAAEVMAFPEPEFEGFDYVGYWVAANGHCGVATPVDVVHTMNLAVGQNHKFVFIGDKKWNQRVSFRVDADKVASLAVKKAMAR